VESHATYEHFDSRGRSVQRLAEREMLHLFEPTEVAEVLQLGGFQNVERFSDLKGGRSAGRKDEMAVFLCHRGP
jgi:hypothetical protein